MTLVWESGITLQHPDNNDPLLDLNTQPSLDLQFASNKSLLDNISGFPLVNHQRDASSGKSAGTYVGSDGLIKTSVVNLFTYSEEFDQSYWSKNRLSISANVSASPTGTFTADQLTVNSGGTFAYTQQNKSVDNGSTTTISVWAKYVNCRYIWLLGGEQPNVFAYFDLINGTVGSTNGYVCSIEDSGNGWYRCSATITKTGASGIEEIGIGLTKTDNNTGDNAVGDSVLIWGAQLEEGSTANDYIPTTNLPSGAPRFDHDPATGESLGLLIEESRTNLVTYSEQFDQSVWAVGGTVSVVPNSALGPNGLMTADQITLGSTGARIGQFNLITTPGQTGTASVYLKNIDHVGQLTLRTGLTGGATYNLNLSLTSEWVRYELTTTHNGTQDVEFHIRETSANPSGSFLVWGAQVEAGSFPTSYIPTDATPGGITRAADVASIEGTNFSSWYNQSEGTVFVAVDKAYKTNTIAASFNDGSADNRVEVRSSGSGLGNARYGILDNSTTLYNKESSTAGANRLKLALAYKTGSVNNATNGVIDIVDATASIPNVSRLAFQNEFFLTDQRPGHIARLAYYPYRLTDTTLQEITS